MTGPNVEKARPTDEGRRGMIDVVSVTACGARGPGVPPAGAPLQHVRPLGTRHRASSLEALLRFTDRARPRTRLGAGPSEDQLSSDPPELGLEEAGGGVATVGQSGVGGGNPSSTRSSRRHAPASKENHSEAASRILARRSTSRPPRISARPRSPSPCSTSARPRLTSALPTEREAVFVREIGHPRGEPRGLPPLAVEHV